MSDQADRIRALIVEGRSNGEIAESIGARPGYVRCIRSRTGPDGKPRRRSLSAWQDYLRSVLGKDRPPDLVARLVAEHRDLCGRLQERDAEIAALRERREAPVGRARDLATDLARDLGDYREQCHRHRKRTRELEDALAFERHEVVRLMWELSEVREGCVGVAVGRAA